MYPYKTFHQNSSKLFSLTDRKTNRKQTNAQYNIPPPPPGEGSEVLTVSKNANMYRYLVWYGIVEFNVPLDTV